MSLVSPGIAWCVQLMGIYWKTSDEKATPKVGQKPIKVAELADPAACPPRRVRERADNRTVASTGQQVHRPHVGR